MSSFYNENNSTTKHPLVEEWTGYDYEEIEKRSVYSGSLLPGECQETDLDRCLDHDEGVQAPKDIASNVDISEWRLRVDEEQPLRIPYGRQLVPSRQNEPAASLPAAARPGRSSETTRATGHSRHRNRPPRELRKSNQHFARKIASIKSEHRFSHRPPKEKITADGPSMSQKAGIGVHRRKRPGTDVYYNEAALFEARLKSIPYHKPTSSNGGSRRKGRKPKPLELPSPLLHYAPDDTALEYHEEDQLADENVSFDEAPEDLPVRILDNFAFFEGEAAAGSETGSHSLYACGNVMPKFVQAGSDTEDEAIGEGGSRNPQGEWREIIIGPIEEYCDMFGLADRKVWIRTNIAWYILQTPHPTYIQKYRPFYLVHILAHFLLLRTTRKRELTQEDFTHSVVGHNSLLVRKWPEIQGVLGESPGISGRELSVALIRIGRYIRGHKGFNGVSDVPLIVHITDPTYKG